jgi:hypothetical protein
MPSYADLPPALIYVYPRVTINMALAIAVDADGAERELVGNVYALLKRLLEHPDRILTYGQIAPAVMPELFHEQAPLDWYDLSHSDQGAIKRAIQMTVFHTRRALGEHQDSHDRPSIILTRATLGYGIRVWLDCRAPILPPRTEGQQPLGPDRER